MSDAEELWKRQSDEEVIRAMLRLDDYVEEGQAIIRAEMRRRGLTIPHPGIHVYRINSASLGWMDIVSVLPEGVVFRYGSVAESIVGRLRKSADDGGTLSLENIDLNPLFADFLHDVIARHAPSEPDLIDEAKRIGRGKVYVIDGRTRNPDGSVPPFDIMGSFVVEEGLVSAGSYERNPNYMILSELGFFRLSPDLHGQLVAELRRRTIESAPERDEGES